MLSPGSEEDAMEFAESKHSEHCVTSQKTAVEETKVHANEREILKAIENDKIWFPKGRQGCDFKRP